MKKIVILFYVFCLAFLPVAASIPAVQEHLSRGRAFYERGRWTDARYELLKAREGFAGDDRMAEQEIDYLLAACGVELGREDAGLPEALLAANQEHCIRMPMRDTCRSLNLSNSVAVGVYEVLRQWDFPELLDHGRLREYEWK